MGSVWDKCAKVHGLEHREFLMRLKQGMVNLDEDWDTYVKDHGMSPTIWLLPNLKYDKEAHPKYLMSGNQEYFDLLFSLLAKSN